MKHEEPLLSWSVGDWAYGGCIEGIWVEAFYLDEHRDALGHMYSLDSGSEVPQHLRGVLKRHVLGKASCVKCASLNGELHLRQIRVRYSSSRREQRHFIVCSCGYPVWRMSEDDSFAVSRALQLAGAALRRKKSLIRAGGKHSPGEIQLILASQENRCIYCNALFVGPVRPTKDHLLPVSYGGSDWALNIVMACRRCNSRRGEIPFRTYCRLLSPTQNRRVLKCLAKRIESMEPDQLPEGVFASFIVALELHDSRHGRYRDILRISPVSRRYASLNRLLPRYPHLLLRRWMLDSSKRSRP